MFSHIIQKVSTRAFYVADHRSGLKNHQNTFNPRLIFTAQNRYELPETVVFTGA